MQVNGAVTNDGTITIAAGETLTVNNAVLTNNGSIEGDGTLNLAGTATIVNNGEIEAGGVDVVGTLDITGSDLVFNTGASFNVDVDTGGISDTLNATTLNLTAAGDILDLHFQNGYTPTDGQTFTIANYASMTGIFDTITDNLAAFDFTVTYGGTSMFVTANELGGVTTGTALPDTLIGTIVADTLIGLGGDDVLDGAGDNDILDGGRGVDTLTGGTGADTFISVIENGRDHITDFNAAEDLLDLSQSASNYSYFSSINGLIDVDTNEGFTFAAGTGLGDVNFDLTNVNAAGGKIMSMVNNTAGLAGSTGDDLIVVAGTTTSQSFSGGLGDDRLINV